MQQTGAIRERYICMIEQLLYLRKALKLGWKLFPLSTNNFRDCFVSGEDDLWNLITHYNCNSNYREQLLTIYQRKPS